MRGVGRRAAEAVVALLLCVVGLLAIPTNAVMHDAERRHLQQQARDMFYHGYRSYMEHAFPWDELKPLSCAPRRWDQRERGDLDDVLGGFSLTLVDSLDMLAVVGDREEFARAVELVVSSVRFDRDVTVSVFESTIRVIGGLVSAHMLASPEHQGVLTSDEYDGELLDLAIDLGNRMLPAFETPTGMPMHRVNLKHGIASLDAKTRASSAITCPAAAGSLLVELSYLSRLSGDPVFEDKARVAVKALWARRSSLNLLGSSISVDSGAWVHSHVGIGAGLDSYFEYLLKYHLVSGDSTWLRMFNQSYEAVETHINHDDMHIEVDMNAGRQAVRSRRVSALQAFWPGLQVLAGDVSGAIRSHEKLFALWEKFGAMPELFDLGGDGSVISWARSSPLRPELIESTYHLYQATRDHRYLKIGRKLLEDMQRVSRVECGYAAVGNIYTLAVEDRMDSYFLSETVKYLYLLFSDTPDVIVPAMSYPNTTRATESTCRRSQGTGSRGIIDEEDDEIVSGISAELDHSTAAPVNNCRCGNSSRTNSSTESIRSGHTFSSRPLKASDVVFSTEGHVLMLGSTLFRRENNASASGTSEVSKCQNGKAQIAKRNAELAPALAQAAVQVGVSVRRGNAHVLTLVASPANFGPSVTFLGHVDAPLALYSSEIGDACVELSRSLASQVAGKLVMVTRGTCSFSEKALILQEAGAVGVIVINSKTAKAKHPDRMYVVTDDAEHHGRQVKIPVVLVSREDATSLHRSAVVVQQSGSDEIDSEGDADAPLVASLSPWLY